MEGGPPSFPRDSSCPVVLGSVTGAADPFAYGAVTHSGGPFQGPSARTGWLPCGGWSPHGHVPQPPDGIGLQPTKPPGFGLCPFRSPLLRASHMLSLPRGTEMFQFPRFPPPGTSPEVTRPTVTWPGFPIRAPRAPRAGPLARAFRGLAAPFIGSWRLGIPREPFAPSPHQGPLLAPSSSVNVPPSPLSGACPYQHTKKRPGSSPGRTRPPLGTRFSYVLLSRRMAYSTHPRPLRQYHGWPVFTISAGVLAML